MKRWAVAIALAVSVGVLAPVIGLASGSSAPPGSGPRTVVEPPYQLGGIDFLNAQAGWVAVGSVHTHDWGLYQTTNGGRSWRLGLSYRAPAKSSQDFPLPGVSMQFINRRIGFVIFQVVTMASDKSVLYRTVDGGSSWKRLNPPPALRYLGTRQTEFVNARDGWTLAESYQGMGNDIVDAERTTDGGRVWRKLPLPAAMAAASIDFSTPKNGWLLASNMATGLATDMRTADGGFHWHRCRTRYPPRPSCGPPVPRMDVGKGPYAGVFLMFPSSRAYLFGRAGLMPMNIRVQRGRAVHFSYWMYHLSRSGQAWVGPGRLPLHMPAVQSKANPAARQAWPPLVDIASPRAWYFADPWYLSFTLDGGRHWVYRQLHLPNLWFPQTISFFGSGSGYLLEQTALTGDEFASRLLATSDGGRSWHAVAMPVPPRAMQRRAATHPKRPSPCPSGLVDSASGPLTGIQSAIRSYLRPKARQIWPAYKIGAVQSMSWATWRVYNAADSLRPDAVAICGKRVTGKSWVALVSPVRPDPRVAYLIERLYLADTTAGWRVWASCTASCFHA